MDPVSIVSFGVCALGFFLLTAMLARRLRGGASALLLTGACASTAVWAGVMTWAYARGGVAAYWGELAELLRTGLWVLFLSHLLSSERIASWARLLRWVAWLVLLPPLGVVALSARSVEPLALDEGIDGAFVYAALAMGVTGLLLLEQVYRNLSAERRGAMKHLCLGIGVVFVYDLYLYADAVLFQRLDPTTWMARGAVDALAVPLIAVSAARNTNWSVDVFVSRHVAFHTTTLVAAGGYLIVMALGGYYIRDFDGTWGGFSQILFLVAAVVALLLVLLSGVARARLKVFLSKHFFSNKYDYREEWHGLIQRLSGESDDLTPPQRAVRAVAYIFDCPAGAVWWQREGEALAPVGRWRMDVPEAAELAPDHPFARFLAERKWVVELPEYERLPQRYDNVALPAWLNELAEPWVIVPLLQQGRLCGILLLCRPRGPAEITWEDRDLLKTLGLQVAIYLSQHENAQALSQARQFEAFNRLTAFLMHDLKNVIAQQSLVVKNAKRHKHNPEFVDDAMMTVGNSVRRMERLLEHLQRGQTYGAVERVKLAPMLEDVCRRCADRAPRPELTVDAADLLVDAEPEGLAMVLSHIVRNAQDATGVKGRVSVTLAATGSAAVIDVEDDGEGMDEAFVRDQLFRPFYSTKASKGMGIGAHQAREFVRGAGGRIGVRSTPGVGTRFRVELPLSAPGATTEGVDKRVVSGS